MLSEKIIFEQLSKSRFEHSLRVADVSVTLAKYYHINTEWAHTAGLLHDYCKEYTREKLIDKAIRYKLISNPLELNMLPTLHGPVAAKVLEIEKNITNHSILQAIEYHTTGHPEMDELAKIIFISDYIEPKRKTPNIEQIKEIAFQNLNQAMLVIVDQTLEYLQRKKELIHPNMINLRNQLLYTERK